MYNESKKNPGAYRGNTWFLSISLFALLCALFGFSGIRMTADNSVYNVSVEADSNTLQQQTCEFIKFLTDTDNVRCGMIDVPENHDDPDSRNISIAYVVLQKLDKSSDRYPMIHLTGGPGAGALTSGRINRWIDHPIREKRDIILFDQRGIGYSSPLPNMHKEIYQLMAGNFNEDEEKNQMKKVMLDFQSRCEQEDINLEYYNSFQNAKDVGNLMRHLKYKKYNIYGTSYGTRLGRIIQDLYPNLLHSVVLNSPAPVEGDMLIDRLKSYSLALSRIFEYCKNNNSCNAQYPNLQSDYLLAIKELESQTIVMDVKGEPFLINAQDGIYFLRRLLYGNNARTQVPALIQEFKNGDAQMINQMIANEFGPGYNYSMWISVERYEQFDNHNTEEKIQEVYQTLPLLPVKLGFFDATYQAFKYWHNATLPEDQNKFKNSGIPTIIMVNQYDPVTPPENGHMFMNRLSNGQLFILDEAGHGGGNPACRDKVMIQFMDDPMSNLDTSCLNLYQKSPK